MPERSSVKRKGFGKKERGNMPLSDRKIKILQAIINDYIATAEPVGSRTIAKKYDMGISSATIRNEMSDLEDMGLIYQPHASSGRIPSDLGYRLYVDKLMQKKELDESENQFLQSVVFQNINHIDYLMEETAKAISFLTKYTNIISEPVINRTILKQIRLLPLDDNSVLLVIATEENFIKNHIIHVSAPIPEEDLFVISGIINDILQGHSVDELDSETITELEEKLGIYKDFVPSLIHAVDATVKSAEKVQVHMSGTKNILAFPEFSDVQKAKDIFQTLEEKDVLVTLLGKSEEEEDGGLKIMIGTENNIQEMKDCSIITASYKMSETTRGSIGIIGPTRMDYSQVVSVLNTMVKNIENVLKSLSDNNKNP